MDKTAEAVAKLLGEKGILYSPGDDHLRVVLPSGFGEIEIGDLENEDTIIGLVNQDRHTHGELLVPEYGDDIPSAIVSFL